MNKLLSTLGLTALFLMGCSTTPIIDYDTEYNFNLPKTYSWTASDARQSDNPSVASDLLNNRLERAFDAQMMAKGYQKIDADGDLLITYHIQTEELERSYTTGTGYGGFGPFYNRGVAAIGGIATTSTTTDSDYVDVTVEIIDSPTGNLVWQSKASERLLDLDSPQKAVEQTNKIAQELFSRYPR